MGFLRAIASAYVNILNFGGRATRPQFWYFQIFQVVVPVGLVMFLVYNMDQAQLLELATTVESNPVYILGSVIFWLPCWSLLVRRLHDSDRSGWWVLMAFVPLLGPLVLLVFSLQPSSYGPNRFGSSSGTARPAPATAWKARAPEHAPTEDGRRAEVRALYLARVKQVAT